MEFRVKKHGKGEGSSKDEKRNAKAKRDESVDDAPAESEKDEKHGGEQDSEQERKNAAGKDMLDAIESGDPERVFLAHRHLHHVHMTSDPEDGGGDPDGMDPHKTSGIVEAIRGMPDKIGV